MSLFEVCRRCRADIGMVPTEKWTTPVIDPSKVAGGNVEIENKGQAFERARMVPGEPGVERHTTHKHACPVSGRRR